MNATIEISALTITSNGNGNSNGNSVKLRSFTVKEYDSLIAAGFFNENDEIELLNGLIINKMPKGTKHSAATDRIARFFYRTFGEKAVIRNQNPIWLDDLSEPEPDIVLAVPDEDFYETKHPVPDEIYLILEVSDSTLSLDRNAKSLAYARAGIQQYLLLNVNEKTLEDYREPAADGFQSKQTYRAGQEFRLVAFPDFSLFVSEFLPAERA